MKVVTSFISEWSFLIEDLIRKSANIILKTRIKDLIEINISSIVDNTENSDIFKSNNEYSNLRYDYGAQNDKNYELDIFFNRNSNYFLIEKWIIKTHENDISQVENKSKEKEKETTSKIKSKFLVFLRSLMTLSRLLPCYDMFIKKDL